MHGPAPRIHNVNFQVLSGHSGQIRSIDFSEDGKFIQSSDSENALLHWQLKPEDKSWSQVKDTNL